MKDEDFTDWLIAREDCSGYSFKKEKTADEMFDDLGLWLERETPFEFEVKNDDDKVIKINKERKEIACFNYYDGFEYFTLKELQAINKKVEELGWN